MKELAVQIVKALVDHPEMVDVNEITGNTSTVLELKVAKSDVGKVIGKEGKTAMAIRTILNAAGRKLNKRCLLEILE